MSNTDLAGARKLYGRDSTGNGVLLAMIQDLHEHLGQLIAYARVNGVVPPRTAARQAAAATRGAAPAGAPPRQQ